MQLCFLGMEAVQPRRRFDILCSVRFPPSVPKNGGSFCGVKPLHSFLAIEASATIAHFFQLHTTVDLFTRLSVQLAVYIWWWAEGVDPRSSLSFRPMDKKIFSSGGSEGPALCFLPQTQLFSDVSLTYILTFACIYTLWSTP